MSAANNALVQHGIGIASASPMPPVLEHNDFWENGRDYEGTAPGDSDLHLAPGFVSPETGDLHLRADSALIHAGTNVGRSHEGFGWPKWPVMGDGDGSAVADIGADEYWAELLGSKLVDRQTATSGDTLTPPDPTVRRFKYHWYSARLNVITADTIPSNVTYVPGSLSASGGAWSDAGGTITWTGTVSNTVPVTLTFKVRGRRGCGAYGDHQSGSAG